MLESAYEECLAYELTQRGIDFERQKPIPVVYKAVHLDCGFRLDLVVENLVIVESEGLSASSIPIHEAQLLTYLKLAGLKLGLLLNFNVPQLRKGIKRLALGL